MLDLQSWILSLSALAEKPPNTMLCIAPILAHASIDIASSGIMGRYIVTRSPFLTPFLSMTLANLFTSR